MINSLTHNHRNTFFSIYIASTGQPPKIPDVVQDIIMSYGVFWQYPDLLPEIGFCEIINAHTNCTVIVPLYKLYMYMYSSQLTYTTHTVYVNKKSPYSTYSNYSSSTVVDPSPSGGLQ